MTDLIHLIEHAITERALFSQGQRILVSVSGGLDSMVLLHALHRLSKKRGWKLVVAHFNHQLRGRSGDADERFVRKTAERLEVQFVAGRADVKRFAQQNKLSVEMAARSLRHGFLARLARKQKTPTVALAHHADDQVELFFLRLLRGAGGEGLAGMKWSGPSPRDPKLTLARPLLACSRKEIRQFARQEKIAYREDKTNAALDFLRNRFRHKLLPQLMKDYQPALAKTTLRLMEVLGAESEFVTQSAAAWLEKKEPPFGQLSMAVQRRSLQLQLFRLGLKAEFEIVEHLRHRPGVLLTLKPGLTVQRDGAGVVHIGSVQTKPKFDAARLELRLSGKAGTAVFGHLKISWQIESCASGRGKGARRSRRFTVRQPGGAEFLEIPRLPSSKRRERRAPGSSPGCESFDADKVGSTIALRHWQPGDRFQPIGMRTSVKLQDLFSNQKVPQDQRRQLVVATTRSGELFWVEGLRMAERFKLDKGTVRRLNWGWQSS